MFKSATTYKAFLGLSLAFFFGLTLGLTLNLVGSQSTDNRSQAADYGHLKNEYCKMTPAEAGQRYLKTCNPDIAGYYGWEVVSDSHAYNLPGDGATNTSGGINRENTVKIGSSVTLQNPFPANSNPKDTRCSAVQHDGDGEENGDVFVQYVVDENNYCMIYHNDYQGKTLKLNRCKLQNLNNGALTYWDNDTIVNGVQTDPALAELKNQFNQKCQTPTSTPVPPTGTLNTVCTPPNQNYISDTNNNLSYNLNLTNIPGNSNAQVQYQLCLHPQSDQGHKHVYQYYFNGGANWEGAKNSEGIPSWACYIIGDNVTTNNSYHSRTWNESIALYRNTPTDPKNIETLAKFVRTSAELGGMSATTDFRTKVVLTVNGVRNDNIGSTQQIKLHTTACYTPSSPTPPPATNTPPQSACTDTQIVHKLDNGDYIANIVNANTGKDFRTKTHTIDLPKADISKPVKVVADWGWTGKIAGNKPQKGKVNLPDQHIDEDDFWQRNESSTISFSAIKPNNSLRSLLMLTCNDVGEVTNNGFTPFVDGYRLKYNNVWRNLQDVYPDEQGETAGNYFFCPQTTAAGWPVAVTNPQGRPDYQYSRILNLTTQDLYNPTTKLLKLQVKRQFLGSEARSDDSVQATDNARTAGSHYTRVTISYCKTN